jgi:hypothetical protein
MLDYTTNIARFTPRGFDLSDKQRIPPASWSVSAKTTYSLINVTCLNNKTRNYLTEKAESSLPFLPTILTSSEASDALLRRSKYLL